MISTVANWLLPSRSARQLAASERREKAEARALLLDEQALHRRHPGLASDSRAMELVITLTVIPQRLPQLHLTIESLLQQSHKADRIVVWLPKDRFDQFDIPPLLARQRTRGVELRYCERHLGPHTKYHYALKAFPDSLVLTVDDDVMYPEHMVADLMAGHRRSPEHIHCHRAHGMRVDLRGRLLPYKRWRRDRANFKPSHCVFPTGVGGVLYFPGCFDSEVLNLDAALTLSPRADDVWLKVMSLRAGTLCEMAPERAPFSESFLTIPGSQEHSLKRVNKQPGGNDAALARVLANYDVMHLVRAAVAGTAYRREVTRARFPHLADRARKLFNGLFRLVD